MQGEAYDVSVGERRANLTWYPSPHYVNEMLGSLGLEPGQDVLRFTHATDSLLTGREYASHLAHGEYPQSNGRDFFRHDRNDDHAIAVILAPEIFTRGVMTVAQAHVGRDELPNISRESFTEQDIVGKFENMTTRLGNIIDNLWPQILRGSQTAELNPLKVGRGRFGRGTKASYMRTLWGMDKQTAYSDERAWQHVADLVFERLSELAPAIAELQKQAE
jgi:hypothetical protein